MPELPEVETVVSGLKAQLLGKSLTSVSNSGKKLRYALPDFRMLYQHSIKDVQRRAKYLLFHFDHGVTLIWHLGMTGQFHVLCSSEDQGKHEHVTLNFRDNTTLRYRDARRFGYTDICETNNLDQHIWFKKLGLEPLFADFNAKYLEKYLKKRKISIKQAIMDNHVVVGVGNIYASESLFRAQVHPAQRANTLTLKQYKSLVFHIKNVLNEAIEAGGSSINDFVKADGKPGYFAHSFQAYARHGQPCLYCKNTINKIVQGGRASFFCPSCQALT